MAIVKHISLQMVRDLHGVVDFYYWRGIPVARMWPRKTSTPPSAAMLGARASFTASRSDLKFIDGATRAAWAIESVGKKQAWLDYYTKNYMWMWKQHQRFPAVVTSFTWTVEDI